MTVRRHPAHHSDPCCFCRRIREGDDLVHVSLLFPDRKRGWVCVEHVRPGVEQSVRFALLREQLSPGGGDSREGTQVPGRMNPPGE